jgi:glycerol-3-phosphate dehydrogenase
LLTLFGGKITTYRRLAEEVLERLRPYLPGLKGPWTATVPLPGGDLPGGSPEAWLARLRAERPWLPEDVARRYVRAYGTLTERLLADVRSEADLGTHFGAGLYEREVAYLADHEWVASAADILWRRSKLGLRLGAEAACRLDDWLGRHGGRLRRTA